MPNFGNVGRELAKEINEEPDVETETEEERKSLISTLTSYLMATSHQAETVF